MQNDIRGRRLTIDLSPQGMMKPLRTAAVKIAPALLGLMLSRVGILGGLYPFAAALAASAPPGMAAPAVIGAVIGFALPGGAPEALRCAASAVAAAGIRWALSEMRRINDSAVFRPLAAFFGVLLTGITVTSASGVNIGYGVAYHAAEGALAGAAAYFFYLAGGVISRLRTGTNRRPLSPQEICSLAVSASVIAIPLCRLRIGGFSPFFSVAVAVVLVCAARLGSSGGAVAGVALGTVAALAFARPELLGICAVGGLMAALFAPVGAVACSAAFMTCCSLGVLATGALDIILLVEALLGCVAFPLLPARFIDAAEGFFALRRCDDEKTCPPSVEHLTERLRRAAEGLNGASQTVCEVSERLDKIDAPPAETVFRKATAKVCADCAISGFCWDTAGKETQRLFNGLTDILRRDGSLCRANTPENLRGRCARWGEMSDTINSFYAEHTAKERARRRVSQVRAAISEQMGGVGELLCELAENASSVCSEDTHTADMIAAALDDCGISCRAVRCTQGACGQLSIDITLALPQEEESEDTPDSLCEDIYYIITDLLDTDFSPAEYTEQEGGMTVRMQALPVYDVRFGAAQHCCAGEELCGDAYDALPDHNRGAYFFLSDGMGSGGRAAVDAALTCGLMRRLLSAGFAEHGAMRLVNSALMVRTEDESLSTADCLRINPYTGEAFFHKAGAAQSFILSGGRVTDVDTPSLPLGIMNRIDCACANVPLSEGDAVIMVSDGAVGEDAQWLREEIAAYADTHPAPLDPRALARDLLSMATARRPSGQDDDITVMVAAIHSRAA